MARFTPVQLFLWYLNTGATIVLIARLAWIGLIPVYRWFAAYLFADTLQQVLGLVYQNDGNRVAVVYMAGTTLRMFLAIFVVLELYRLALAEQPALSRYGRTTVGWVLGVAVIVASSLWLIDRPVPPGQSRTLYYFFSSERTMDASLFVFLVIVSAFMSWFPVRLKRNVTFYIGGFVIYFFARSVGLFLQNALPHVWTTTLGNEMLSVSFVCLFVWVFALSRKGEEATLVVGHQWNPREIQHLTDQLESINRNLSRL